MQRRAGGRCDCIMDERIECDGPEFQVQPQRHSNHGTAASLEGWMDRVQIGHHAVHILSGRVGLAYYILYVNQPASERASAPPQGIALTGVCTANSINNLSTERCALMCALAQNARGRTGGMKFDRAPRPPILDARGSNWI
jgi:hypothetical protein